MSGADLLTLTGPGPDALARLADRAQALARLWDDRRMPTVLQGRRVALIADLPGWRNPTALELGARAMGAVCLSVPVRLSGPETAEDLAGYLGNWFDALAIRTPELARLTAFAAAAPAPVLNLRTNDNHPVEVLGDLAFVLSRRESWDGLRVAVAAPAGNIARSWAEAGRVLPIEVVQVCPGPWALPPQDGCRHSDDAAEIAAADLIITDCHPAGLDAEGVAAFARTRIDAALLDRSGPGTLFLPCPPVTRGREVTADALAHPKCAVPGAKAWLLHVQNAWLERAAAGETF